MIREDENELGVDRNYGPVEWQRTIPELVVDLTWYHLFNIRPHGAVNMLEARNICRLELAKLSRIDADKLIMLAHRKVVEGLALPKDGVWVEFYFERFPLIYYRIHPIITWGLLDVEVYDDINTKMRSIIDVSISASGNGALLRYDWTK